MIAGNAGLGKSLLTLDCAARVSRGLPWPDAPNGTNKVGSVLLLTAEDDLADTVVPRLLAAGADMSRIHAMQSVRIFDPDGDEPTERLVSLDRDVAMLEQAIKNIGDVRLVIVDPLGAYCGKVNANDNAEIRGLLVPLADLAARHDVAVVVVHHLNKSQTGSALHRIMGSVGIAAAARSVWGVMRDEDDPQRRLFLPIKSNIGPDELGLSYRLDVADDVPRVTWDTDAVAINADDAMSPDSDGERSRIDEAVEFLRELLDNGQMEPDEVKAEAGRAGIAERTLERAKKRAGVVSEMKREPVTGGKSHISRWVWRLGYRADQPP